MNPNSVFGIISALALLIPVLVIIALRLFTNKSFLALAIYYLIVSLQILMKQNVINASQSFYQSFVVASNLLDAPLMLSFLLFFKVSPIMTKRLSMAILGFIGLELVVVAARGFNIQAVIITLGPDIAIVLVVSLLLFLRNARLAVSNSKNLGKAIMICAILLSYSLYSLVYIFYYLEQNKKYQDDARLIYYLVTILSALIMAVGIIIENKRIKKLDELKNTRRELATIYGDKNVAALNKDSRFFTTL